jgi:hypothetical protein
MAWKLTDGWDTKGRDIGWSESVAVELAILWVTEQDVSNKKILIHGDNTGIIDAYKRGIPVIFHTMLQSNALLPASFLPTLLSLLFSYLLSST